MDNEISTSGYITSDGKAELNMSDIFTRLIQEAGRWCESYASDVLFDIDSIRKYLDNIIPNAEKTWRFGFRRNGVDHAEWVHANCENEARKYYYYRSIYRLTVKTSDTGIKAELTRID